MDRNLLYILCFLLGILFYLFTRGDGLSIGGEELSQEDTIDIIILFIFISLCFYFQE